ncbi:MAG: S8 family serine peptidase [Lawsonibacter sp.]|nr:S8 family serine peptidase [Lawsonibacter sp.]
MDEYIIKYNGVLDLPGVNVDILNESYAIITTDRETIERLSTLPQIEYFESAKKLFPQLHTSMRQACITPVKNPSSAFGLTGQGVAVGIIDSGIDLTHPEFIDKDGKSRVWYLWDMTATGTPPAGFSSGAEYEVRAMPISAVTSDDTNGHGTAVACIAAGNGGVASDAAILAVKLNPNPAKSTDIMRGVKYLIDRAKQLNMPVAINISYGTNNGSHTGQSLFETYLTDISQQWKTSIVCASGNEGFGGHHYTRQLIQEEILRVEFATATIRPSMYLTLWKNFADTVEYELVAPSGRISPRLTNQQRSMDTVLDGVHIKAVFGLPNHYTVLQEIYFEFEGLAGSIPDGVWTLVCYARNIVDGSFHIWLPTIEEVTEDTAFLEPSILLTMTLPSTSHQILSVGGYQGYTDVISTFSGRGDVLHAGQVQLDLVAPAENILSAKAGGGYDTFTGTSFAAPFVTGAAALMMQWGIVRGNDPFLYGERIKASLCRSAQRSPGQIYPNPSWGYGALRLCDSMRDLVILLGR